MGGVFFLPKRLEKKPALSSPTPYSGAIDPEPSHGAGHVLSDELPDLTRDAAIGLVTSADLVGAASGVEEEDVRRPTSSDRLGFPAHVRWSFQGLAPS